MMITSIDREGTGRISGRTLRLLPGHEGGVQPLLDGKFMQ